MALGEKFSGSRTLLKASTWLFTIACVVLPCSVAAQVRMASAVEAAGPGLAYDYAVHVRNTYDYRYNPEVREDRILMAKQAARPFCPNSRIVGERKFKTAIFGLTTGKPDYVVYLKCRP